MQKKAASAYPRRTGRGRRLALAAIAAAALAAAGAAAIYAIHRTMPGPEFGAGTAQPGRKSPDPPAPTDQAGSGPRADAPAAKLDQEPPAGNAGAPGSTAIAPPLPPVSLRPPGAAETSTAAEAPGRPPRAPGPQAQAAGSKAPPGRAQAPAAPPAAPAPPAASPPGAGAATKSPAAAGVAARPRTLDDAQRSQCAGEGALSKMICNERVRLRFCRDAWNSHPDCMVAPQRGEP